MTSSERHGKVTELFLAACKLPPAKRAAYLDQACAGDAELRAEVEALLAQDSEHADFLKHQAGSDFTRTSDSNATDHPAQPASADALGRSQSRITIEGYEILRELHRGGQGVVYQAIQKSTKRKVAIKVLAEGHHASKRARKRFEREIELVAQLKHPCIISIFHSGVSPEGMQYYVMDYVRGLHLDEHVRQKHLTLEDTLRLFAAVCEAVQYAHRKGVMHRDLKPSNILVDSAGSPRVLDFGLAKAMIEPVDTVISITQQVIGTLPYMSPEQARGNPDDIDTRTDIYALGVILYEMLTGHYPYPVVGQMAEVLKHIADTPPKPLTRSWTRDSGVTTRTGKSKRGSKCPIDNELETVVLKTLSKEPERRYQSAGELGRDIERYLKGDPIEAKRDSGWYVFTKTLHRHRTKAVVAASFAVLIGVFGMWMRHTNALRESERLAEEGKAIVARDSRSRRGIAYDKFNEALSKNSLNYKALGSKALWKKNEYFQHRPLDFTDPELLEEAEQLCDQALALSADSAPLWNLKSVILYSLGKLKKAEAACRRTLELDQDYFYAASNLAKVLAMQGRLDEALAAVKQGTEMNARLGEDTKYDDGVWLTLGTLQLHLQNPEAMDSIQRAKKIDLKDVRNHLMLARAYLTLGKLVDTKLALEVAKNTVAFAERYDPRYSRILAQAFLVNEEYADASRHADAAVQGGDLVAFGRLIGAIAEAQMGNTATAQKYVDQALASWPEAFASGERVLVTAEKGLLWFDTAAELEGFRDRAQQLIQTHAAAPQ